MRKLVFGLFVFLMMVIFVGWRYSVDWEVFEKNDSGHRLESFVDMEGEDAQDELWYVPKPGVSWQWQLQREVDMSYDVDIYDVDLFDVSESVIGELHERGVKVICYISVGSFEDWREDASAFPESVLGRDYDGWAGERWLDISEYEKFEDVMLARLDLAVGKKCDGIEPDNIHAYQEDTGFLISYNDQIKYNVWLADEAHKRNLSIALKNDGEQAKDLVGYYDFAVVEECFEMGECDFFKVFVENGKAVLGVEYNLELEEFCEEASRLNFSWLKIDYALDGGRVSCG